MANYYRVNLKDKAGNIIYPNIHNLISINKTTGGMTLSQGGITLSNGKLISKGLSLRGGHLYLEGTYGAILDNTTKIVFGTPESNYANITANSGGAIGFYASLTDKTNGFFWNPGQKAISPENNNQLSCGMSDKRWTNVYSVNGNFSGQINSSVMTNSHIAGNRGENVIINSTRTEANAYVMLARFKSSNGVFTIGRWRDAFHLFYTAQSVVDAGTNGYTKNLVLLNESGNSIFPGMVKVSNQIQASTAGAYRIAMGGGDSYAWIDCRDNTDTMVTNMTLTPNGINLYKNTYIGGTLLLTNNISIERHGSTQIPLKVYGGDANGQGISIGAGGATIIGSGESKASAEAELAAATEKMWMLSDTDIQFTVNCQTWADRVSINLDTSRRLYPTSDNTGGLGLSNHYWASSYIKKMHGQLEKVSSFFNAGYAGLSYYDGEAMSTSVSNNGWAAPSGAWYQVLHLDLSVDNYYNDLYFPVNSRECLYWRQRCSGGYYGFFSIPASWDKSVRNFRAGTKATWDSNYSGYVNGTVMFCW